MKADSSFYFLACSTLLGIKYVFNIYWKKQNILIEVNYYTYLTICTRENIDRFRNIHSFELFILNVNLIIK